MAARYVIHFTRGKMIDSTSFEADELSRAMSLLPRKWEAVVAEHGADNVQFSSFERPPMGGS